MWLIYGSLSVKPVETLSFNAHIHHCLVLLSGKVGVIYNEDSIEAVIQTKFVTTKVSKTWSWLISESSNNYIYIIQTESVPLLFTCKPTYIRKK